LALASLLGLFLASEGRWLAIARAAGISVSPRLYLPFVPAASLSGAPTPTPGGSPTATPTPGSITCLSATSLRTASSSLTTVGQLGGTMSNVVVQGNYAYVGVGPSLAIIDVSNPAQLTLVGQSTPLRGAVVRVAVAGNRVYATYDYGT